MTLKFAFAGSNSFAVLKGGENYEDLRDALQPVWDEINGMKKDGRLNIDEALTVPIKLTLTGDMKVNSIA